MTSSQFQITDDLYDFVRSFLTSTEEALKLLEKASGIADFISKLCSVVPYFGRVLASSVTSASKDILQKRDQLKVGSLKTDSSLEFHDVFQKVFVTVATEIYFAFEFQLKEVYLKVDGKKNKPEGLRTLANYAGARCFKHLLDTGSIENLHQILVPSISSKKGYGEFENEPRNNWTTLLNVAETTLEQIKSFTKPYLTYTLGFDTLDAHGKLVSKKPTVFQFFDKCIPGFDPAIPKIKTKLESESITWTSNSIAVDKFKLKETKSNQYYLLRRPFKIEIEKIKEDNLAILENVAGKVVGKSPGMFIHTELYDLVEEIIHKINRDPSYDSPTAIFHRMEDISSKLDKVLCYADKQIPEKELVKTNQKLPSRVWFQVTDPPELFVGREEVLNQIEENINEQKQPGHRLTIISQTNIISGLGGVGKTTVACEFILRFSQNNPGCNVAFIFAQTQDSLKKSFCKLAMTLKLLKDPESFDWEIIKFKIFKRICDRKCLLVFDNAVSLKKEGDTNNGIEEFLPSLPSELIRNLSILVTTRNRAPSTWGNRQPILLNVFTDSESIEFVMELLGENLESEKNIMELSNLCGKLPLALELTTAYILQNKIDFVNSGYSIKDFLAEDKIRSLVCNDPENLLYTTWDLSLKNIRKLPNGDLALFILNMMAFSHQPDLIYYQFLEKFFSCSETKESIARALGLLVKYSLISISYDPEGTRGAYYSIHRMIQMVTKERLVGKIDDSLEYIFKFVSIISNHYEGFDFYFIQEWSYIFTWVSSSWEDEHAWQLSNKLVRTIMGKEDFNSASVMSSVYSITRKYLSLNDGSHESFHTPNTQVKNRALFLISKSWSDFDKKAKALKLSSEIVKRVGTYEDSSNADTISVTLLVLIGKVEKSSDSGAWVILAEDDNVPKELCNCDWDEKDSQTVFFQLPSQYYRMFSFLLGTIFGSSLPNSRKLYYFIGANILANILFSAKNPYAMNIFETLIAFIDTGMNSFNLKRIGVPKMEFVMAENYTTFS